MTLLELLNRTEMCSRSPVMGAVFKVFKPPLKLFTYHITC